MPIVWLAAERRALNETYNSMEAMDSYAKMVSNKAGDIANTLTILQKEIRNKVARVEAEEDKQPVLDRARRVKAKVDALAGDIRGLISRLEQICDGLEDLI